MSDEASKKDVESVVSSVRRFVSGARDRAGPVPNAGADASPERPQAKDALVLPQQLRTDTNSARPAQNPPVAEDGGATPAAGPATQDASAAPASGNEEVIDEAELRALIADVLREELRGQIGLQASSNIRKLIRQEIQRALSAAELDWALNQEFYIAGRGISEAESQSSDTRSADAPADTDPHG